MALVYWVTVQKCHNCIIFIYKISYYFISIAKNTFTHYNVSLTSDLYIYLHTYPHCTGDIPIYF